MTTTTMQRPVGRSRSFFTIMAIVTAVIVAAGFGPTYAHSLPAPGLPFWVHLHGAAMTVWIALFIVQTQLIGHRNLALHKRLGWLSTGLVAVIGPLGLATTTLAVARGATPPFFTGAGMMGADLVDLIAFTGLFVAAVLLRKHPDWHKRLLLCATILLTWPAFGRMAAIGGASMQAVLPIATLLLLILAAVGPVYDLITRRRVHPAYMAGVATILMAQPLHILVAASAPMQALAQRLGG